MQVRVPPKEIAKRVYGDNGSRNGAFFRHGFLEEFLQGFPIPPQDFGYAEDKMAVGYGLEDFFAGRRPSGDSEAVVQDAAIQVSIDDMLYVGS